MIGVACRPDQRPLAEELFQLFKAPWSWARPGGRYGALIVAGADDPPADVDAPLVLRFGPAVDAGRPHTVSFPGEAIRLPLYAGVAPVELEGAAIGLDEDGAVLAVERRDREWTTVVLGFDLLDEVGRLLGRGQPEDEAPVPTLDLHIELLRRWMTAAGVPVVELLPAPAGRPYAVCMTHDIDFVGIRRHGFDHTVAGFLYRATVGSVRAALRGRRSWRDAARNLAAVAELPLIHLGLRRDLWRPFDDYESADGSLPSTFFVVPFRDRPGERVPGQRTALRATRYDVRDVAPLLPGVERRGSEVAVHGIDAWHSSDAGSVELAAVADAVGRGDLGVRMHWLCYEDGTPKRLEQAGFAWDATFGYNGAVGYRAGTTQVFAPPGTRDLLEVPLHAQDTALFLPRRLDLDEEEAWEACAGLRRHAREHGGVLTFTWHDRSLAPERRWGAFYRRLLRALRDDGAWFQTVSALVAWTRCRRAVRLGDVEVSGRRVRVHLDGPRPPATAPLALRVRARGAAGRVLTETVVWRGEEVVDVTLPEGVEIGATTYPSG